jgi:hypothetical protein
MRNLQKFILQRPRFHCDEAALSGIGERIPVSPCMPVAPVPPADRKAYMLDERCTARLPPSQGRWQALKTADLHGHAKPCQESENHSKQPEHACGALYALGTRWSYGTCSPRDFMCQLLSLIRGGWLAFQQAYH